jgi:hypothetical protein
MSSSRNTGPLVGGALLIAFGVLTLLGQVFQGLDFWGTFWPFIIIAFGALFFVAMLASGRSLSGLAIPGSIFTVIGLMLLYQSLTGHWESWSYGWTVILMSIGLGIFIMGVWGANPNQRRSGLQLLRLGMILFVIFGAFFELIFNTNQPLSIRSVFFPSALILLGLYLLVSRSGLIKTTADSDQVENPSKFEEKS